MTTMSNTGPQFMKLRELILIPFDDLDWDVLSSNPNAIPILEKNLDKVHWSNLSSNPNANPILEKNLDKVNQSNLSSNPNIFTYDYHAMKYIMFRGGIKEDLMKDRFHPRNLHKFKGWGFDFDVYDE